MTNPENESYQLPPGTDHRWVVVYKGFVQPELIIADAWYTARERASAKFQCDRVKVHVGLLPIGLNLQKVKKRKTRSKKK